MVLVAFLIGFFFAYNMQEEFMSLFKGKIRLANDLNINTIGISIAFILFTGIISGVIPSVQIMKFKPIDVVKGSFRYNSKMVMSRIFIIIQNVITVTMLTASLVIILQIHHLVNAPLGINVKNVFCVHSDYIDVARDAAESLPRIEKVGIGPDLASGCSSFFLYQDENGKYIMLPDADMDSVVFEIYGFTRGYDIDTQQVLRTVVGVVRACRAAFLFRDERMAERFLIPYLIESVDLPRGNLVLVADSGAFGLFPDMESRKRKSGGIVEEGVEMRDKR